MYLRALPSAALYERSYMHRDAVTHLLVVPRVDFVVSARCVVCLPVCLYVCLSVFMSVCLSACLTIATRVSSMSVCQWELSTSAHSCPG